GYRHDARLSWFLPTALLITAAVQVYLLNSYPEWASRLTPVVIGGGVVGALALTALRLPRGWRGAGRRTELAGGLATALCVMALLVAPAVWAGLEPITGESGGFLPSAGPARGGFFGGAGFPGAPFPPEIGGPGAPPALG